MHVAKTGSGSGETSRPAPLPLADDDAARVTGEEEERTVFAGAPSRHIGSLTRQQSLWMRRRPCSGWPLNSQRGPVFEGALSGRQPEGRPARDRRLWAPEIAVFWAGILHALFLAGHCSSHWGCSGPCAWAGTGAAPAGHSNRSMVHAGEGVLVESTTVSAPVAAPCCVGAKAMEMVQPVSGARLRLQVFCVMVKAPLTISEVRLAVVPPVFETVMFWTALCAPTLVEGKVREVGVSTTAAPATAVPLSVAVACPPGALP